jgi:hypothetical protein
VDPGRVLIAERGKLFQRALGAPITPQMLHHRPGGIERMAGDIGQLCRPVGLGIPRQGYMGDIPQP